MMLCHRRVGMCCNALKNIPLVVSLALVFTAQATLLNYPLVIFRGGDIKPSGCAPVTDVSSGLSTPAVASADSRHDKDNQTLASDASNPWYVFVLFDVLAFLCLAAALVLTAAFFGRHLFSSEINWHNMANRHPLSAYSWFIYTLLLSVKVGILFTTDVAACLIETDLYGPNYLKTGVALTSVVFIIFAWGHHKSDTPSETNIFIAFMLHNVTFDLLDSINALDILFKGDIDGPGASHGTLLEISPGLAYALLVVACISLIRPTISFCFLYLLQCKERRVRPLKLANALTHLILVNIPFLVARLTLWHTYSADVSVFLLKNAIMIAMAFKDVLDYLHEGLEPRTERQRKMVRFEQAPDKEVTDSL